MKTAKILLIVCFFTFWVGGIITWAFLTETPSDLTTFFIGAVLWTFTCVTLSMKIKNRLEKELQEKELKSRHSGMYILMNALHEKCKEDMKGIITLSESPKQTVSRYSRYYTVMTKIISREKEQKI